jgi:hypothetical protein
MNLIYQKFYYIFKFIWKINDSFILLFYLLNIYSFIDILFFHSLIIKIKSLRE